MPTAEELRCWNIKLLRVCGLSLERVLTLCIPACLGRKLRESVTVFIDLHLQLDLTCLKENESGASPRVIFVIDMSSLIGKVRNRSPLYLSNVKRLMKPSQSALSTVSCWRRECWMEVPLYVSPNKRCKESREHVDVMSVTSERSH